MVSDDQYEIFWYDLKLPELVEENDSSKDKIGELCNVNQITKDGWKLISIIPFSIKKNNKDIQIHRLYFQRGGKVFAKEVSERYNHYLQTENKENKKEETNNTNIINKNTLKKSKSFRSSITPLQNLNLPTPTFCSIVRYVTKSGFLDSMVEEIIKSPSNEAVSQHTILTGENEIMNISLVPDLDGMVSKEETGVQWLDTVEHMLVKFENGSRTEAISGPIVYYSFNEKNAEYFENKSLKTTIINLNVKKGKDLELIEQVSKPKLPENIILYCIVQTDQEKFTIICKHALDCTNNDNLVSLVIFGEIDQLLNSFDKSISNSRSGHSFDNFNSLFLP